MTEKMISALGAISPYASIGAGLLEGIGSLFGSSKRNKAQLEATRLTNETNRQIAAETNAMNYRISQENNAFNKSMYEQQNRDQLAFWNMQNEYNDPSQEVSRLRAAGLNPAMFYGNGTPAGSIATATAPTADQSGHQEVGTPVQAPDIGYQPTVAEAVGNSLQQAVSMYRSISESRIAQTDADFAYTRALKDIEESASRTKKNTVEHDIAVENLNFLRATRENRFEQSGLQTELQRESINHMREMITDMKAQRTYREGILKLQQDMHQFEQEKFAKEYEALCKRIAIEQQNANTMAYNAKTGRMDYELSNKQYEYGKKLAFRDYLVNLKKMGMDEKNAARAAKLAREQFEWSKKHPILRAMGTIFEGEMRGSKPGPNMFGGLGATSSW